LDLHTPARRKPHRLANRRVGHSKITHSPKILACLGRFADRNASGLGCTTLGGARFLHSLPGLMKLTEAVDVPAATLPTSGLRVGVISVGISGIFLGAVGVLFPWLAFDRAPLVGLLKTQFVDTAVCFCGSPLKPFQENACGKSPPFEPPTTPLLALLSKAIPPRALGAGGCAADCARC